MASLSEHLKIIISGDASGATKAFGEVGKTAGGFGASLTGAIKVGGLAALAALTTVAASMVAVVKKATDNWIENELIQTKLNNTLNNTGKFTGVTIGKIKEYAKEIQNLTRYEDDQVMAGAEILARQKVLNSEVFPEALSLTADLAESMGVDFTTAASAMAKALADPGQGLRILKQAGVVLDDQTLATIEKLNAEGKSAESVKLIFDALQGSVGGVATAAGQTASGAIDRMKNTWDGFLDTIAEKMGPSITQILNFMAAFLTSPEVLAFVNMLAIQIGNLTTYIAANLPMWTAQFQQFMAIIVANKDAILAVLAVIGVIIAAFAAGAALSIGALMLPIAALVLLIIGIQKAFVALQKFGDEKVKPWLADIAAGWKTLSQIVLGFVDRLKQAWDFLVKIASVNLKFLQPGSPTPFEMGLRGINTQLDVMSKKTLPSITGGVSFQTGSQNNGASEMAGIRDEIKFLVRTLPRAIANANA